MIRRTQVMQQREEEIMKDVAGWQVGESVYHSKRYVEPRVIILPDKK
jgi:NADH dehydrogenase (ubiquinone) 1 alpha subcomplex subunit 13